jgi:nicotinate-nucleotide adenylyltransferase
VKYCIFGGSFDPPHAGHKYLAKSALATLRLDKLIWVPAPDPPHKDKPATPFEHRLAMVKLAIAGEPRQSASGIEATLPKPSYTINTIEALKSEYGREHAWYLLIGADNWSIFQSWHRWQDVLRETTVAVFPRRGHTLGALPAGVLRLDLPEMDVEATEIRQSLRASGNAAEGETAGTAGLLPEIRAYAASQGLYGLGRA